jgi:hypothetical protein
MRGLVIRQSQGVRGFENTATKHCDRIMLGGKIDHLPTLALSRPVLACRTSSQR